MDNLKYVQSLGIDEEAQQRCLTAMEHCGLHHWWEPDVDPREYAYYQLHEPIMLGTFRHFHESIELLLGRPVYMHEFGSLGAEKLRQEAERAWEYQIGAMSEAECAERVRESLQSLQEWAEKKGKQIIEVILPEE